MAGAPDGTLSFNRPDATPLLAIATRELRAAGVRGW